MLRVQVGVALCCSRSQEWTPQWCPPLSRGRQCKPPPNAAGGSPAPGGANRLHTMSGGKPGQLRCVQWIVGAWTQPGAAAMRLSRGKEDAGVFFLQANDILLEPAQASSLNT